MHSLPGKIARGAQRTSAWEASSDPVIAANNWIRNSQFLKSQENSNQKSFPWIYLIYFIIDIFIPISWTCNFSNQFSSPWRFEKLGFYWILCTLSYNNQTSTFKIGWIRKRNSELFNISSPFTLSIYYKSCIRWLLSCCRTAQFPQNHFFLRFSFRHGTMTFKFWVVIS